jgi:transcriptional regulator
MAEPTSRDLFPGALEMMVLRLLKAEPLHGYALVRRIQALSNNLLQVEEGSLYPALQRLEDRGWIKGSWGTSKNNRRARFYTLTATGRKQFVNEAGRWHRLVESIARVLGPEPVEG